MAQIVGAYYDGVVLHPEEPLPLEKDTRVRLTIEALPESPRGPRGQGFLATAAAMELNGPPDWSTHVDEYLYALPDA